MTSVTRYMRVISQSLFEEVTHNEIHFCDMFRFFLPIFCYGTNMVVRYQTLCTITGVHCTIAVCREFGFVVSKLTSDRDGFLYPIGLLSGIPAPLLFNCSGEPILSYTVLAFPRNFL